MKNQTIFYIGFILMILTSCSDNKIKIEPINSHLNERLKTGKSLSDPNYFTSGFVFQYYQISDYSNLSDEKLLDKLESFVNKKYPYQEIKKHDDFMVFFYKKKFFSDYDYDTVYESARDNEFGEIDGFDNNLVSKIYYYKYDGMDTRKIFGRVIYKKDKLVFSKEDTISF
ncbi:hypothetical protein [Flavobacterium mesophilum]|uniref:hypothetical protein n=1 Tax=Flavobacterium mesophilum TaxID=3143495 RepID=UPI0031DE4A63